MCVFISEPQCTHLLRAKVNALRLNFRSFVRRKKGMSDNFPKNQLTQKPTHTVCDQLTQINWSTHLSFWTTHPSFNN